VTIAWHASPTATPTTKLTMSARSFAHSSEACAALDTVAMASSLALGFLPQDVEPTLTDR
jgi:hypothetical protein